MPGTAVLLVRLLLLQLLLPAGAVNGSQREESTGGALRQGVITQERDAGVSAHAG